MKSSEGGLLQVCMEGVGLLFANSKVSNFYWFLIAILFIYHNYWGCVDRIYIIRTKKKCNIFSVFHSPQISV